MSDAARGIRASVIVLGYNGRRYLDAAISSLLDQDMPADQFEVIYVDDDSADGSADHVAEHFPHVRVLRLKENLGFYGAFDLAAADAAGLSSSPYRRTSWLTVAGCPSYFASPTRTSVCWSPSPTRSRPVRPTTSRRTATQA